MKKNDFNRGWIVVKEGQTRGRLVNLPHDAMIYENRRKEAAGSGACGYFEEGKYTYTHTFTAPEEWTGKTLILECEAVYKNSSVLLNGELLYERPYGYTNYFVNLTGKVKAGQENEITIIADNSKAPNSRWYSGSGIYREVQLYTGPKQAIAPEGIRVITEGNLAKVTVEALSEGEDAAAGLPVLVTIAAADAPEEILAKAEGVSGEAIELTVEGAKKWSAEKPDLYICRAVVNPQADADIAQITFGFRDLSWNSRGFFVNGQETLLRGGCIHHDNGILGAATFADAEERRVRIMKEAGFNAIRCAHNPMSKAMLDACDRLGMYVMDENFDMWFIHKNPYDYGKEDFIQWWKADTKAMVDKDYSHPCVVLYSIGNEISDLGMEQGQKMCAEMSSYVRSLDSTRPLTMGINLMLASMVAKGKGMYGNGKEGEKETNKGSQSMDSVPTSTFFNIMMNRMGGLMELSASSGGADKIAEAVSGNLDMPGYNYASARYKKEAKKYPDRPFTGSETLPKRLYKNWQLVKEIPNLTGDFMWTAWDYLGESAIGTVRYIDQKTKEDVDPGLIISGGAGIIDICGKARPEVGWGKLIWDLQEAPTVGVEPYTHADDFRAVSMWRNTDAVESWSWEGCEGKKSEVVVYAKEGSVKLVVNGKSYGRKRVKEGQAHFKNIPYQPGYIGAVSYDPSGAVRAKTKLSGAKGPTQISLKPEKTLLRANGQDLCFLNIELTGKNGIVKSSVDQKLTVTVEGAGSLQAFGSSRPCMAENFYSDTHTTYYGKALAAIRAGYAAGEIRITVSGEGLAPQTITVIVE